MFVIKNEIINQLTVLKKRYKLTGIKAEFEAEGSSFEDVSNLRIITRGCDIRQFIKIGGVEATNDIYKCIEIGVDGIIAPMVESKFAMFKFVDFFRKKKLKNIPHLSVNIETKTGYENLDDILSESKGFIKNITVGRSDLSKSFFKPSITPDCKFIQKIIIDISKKAKKKKITTTVGGSLSVNTIKEYQKSQVLIKAIKKFESRKVIMETASFMKSSAIKDALKFEKTYIMYKNELYNFKSQNENNRLSILKSRTRP